MKTSRILIAILCATNVIAMLTVAWQARTIQSLVSEQTATRQDLRTALAVGAGKASPAPVPQSNQDRLELIKLRHETRELRQRLVDAHATQPNGVSGLIHSLLPSGAGRPTQLRPEWKGLEQNLTNRYTQAINAVNNGTNDYLRFLYLTFAAKASLGLGRNEEARHFAEDALALNEKYSRGSPEKVNGDVVHDANMVLGRIAMDEGRIENAKELLLVAGQTPGSSGLSSSGPNMGLAKDLLEHGEQGVVLKYFELCRKFWGNKEKLALWKADVEEGRIPEFGGQLLH